MSDQQTINGQEALRARLTELVGPDMANKLADDINRSILDFGKQLKGMVVDCLKTRMSLTQDDLNESRYTDGRAEALQQVKVQQTYYLYCFILDFACTMALEMGEPMSKFIGHAAEHYETGVLQLMIGKVADAAMVKRL